MWQQSSSDPYISQLYAVDYLRRLRWVITEELPRSVFAAAPVPLMQAPVRGGRGRGGYNRGGYSKPPLMPGPPMSQGNYQAVSHLASHYTDQKIPNPKENGQIPFLNPYFW